MQQFVCELHCFLLCVQMNLCIYSTCITEYDIEMDMVPSIIDVWGYDKEFCSSSPSPPSY